MALDKDRHFHNQYDCGICQRGHHLGEQRSLGSESSKTPGTWVGTVNAIFRQQKSNSGGLPSRSCKVGPAHGLHLSWKLSECTRESGAQRSDFEWDNTCKA